MGGTIRLLNIPLFGHHGVSGAERETGTLLEFDVEMEVDLEPAAASDRVEDTVNYMAVHEEVRGMVRDQHFHLLESLAGAIAGRLIDRFEATRVEVRVRKSNLPLSGGRVEVALTRERPRRVGGQERKKPAGDEHSQGRKTRRGR